MKDEGKRDRLKWAGSVGTKVSTGKCKRSQSGASHWNETKHAKRSKASRSASIVLDDDDDSNMSNREVDE